LGWRTNGRYSTTQGNGRDSWQNTLLSVLRSWMRPSTDRS
jgi:hypothetical protein